MVTTGTPISIAPPPLPEAAPRRVVYLLGAGATQGSVSYSGGTTNLLMRGLSPLLISGMQELINSEAESRALVGQFINDIMNEDADFEQLTTFLEDAPSAAHRRVAAQFKEVFFSVLQGELRATAAALGGSHSELLAALIDMHQVDRRAEDLAGFLTLNYDSFLEHAIETHLGMPVDYGVSVQPGRSEPSRSIRVLKLHGSFSWVDAWPMTLSATATSARWIPPGIRKAKSDYPYSAIWGLARELLDCDVVRIVGCKLRENDWDLISLLFTTMHAHADGRSYELEIIGRPQSAREIQRRFPYLRAKSILEIEGLGDSIVAEMLGGPPTRFASLAEKEQDIAEQSANKIGNPFAYWLTQMGEAMIRELGSISTDSGRFEAFVAAR